MVYDLLVEIGDTFEKWTVISLEAPKYRGHIQVRVQCECGNKRAIPRSHLTRNERPSRQCQVCARKVCAAMRFGTRTVKA
jgi:hypothetical protein